METTVASASRPWRKWAAAMWLATALFAFRVIGQAVQRWLPVPWLPAFREWQGSATPYPVLLAIQLVIIGAMAHASWRAWTGSTGSSRAMQGFAWLGALYMFVAVGRIAIGLSVDDAPAWFRAWISGAFHVVLAGFVLALARYHFLRNPARGDPS
jgi:hypothetical protein